MFTYEELYDFLNHYQERLDQYQELTDRLLLPCSQEEWMKILEERSAVIRETFVRNEEWFPRIYAEMKDMTWEKAKIYYKAVNRIYFQNNTNWDFPLMIDLLEGVVPVFEKEAPVEHQISLNNILSFLYGCYYDAMGGTNHGECARSYIEKAISYRKYYTQLDRDARMDLWGAYENLFGAVGSSSFETLAGWYDDMLAFWKSDVVQQTDGKDEEFIGCIEAIQDAFLRSSYSIMRERVKNTDRAEYKHCLKDIEEKLQPLLKSDSVAHHNAANNCKVLLDIANGRQNAKELVYRVVDELEAYDCDGALEKSKDELSMLASGILAKIRFFTMLICMADLDREEKCRISNRMLRLFVQKMGKLPSSFEKEIANKIYALFFFDIISYMDTFGEKENMLEKLIISRQPQTFVHSYMVGKLAVMATEAIMETKPEIFAGIPGFETVELLQGKKEEFLAYVEKCGALHDIGKCRVSGVINMQMHKVTDEEFTCIKRHPWYGRWAFDKDPDFAPYIPVILGHHKTYDGTKGYPADFDILSSPYKPVIDLISICDSLDAATDQLGRNYNKAKKFDVVLEEFRQGAGTRYNPDIVKVIEEDVALQEKMCHLVTDGRADAYYEAYRQCQKFAEMTV